MYAGTSALSLGVFHACLLHPADIDECLEYGTCPQACKNTKGSYDCDCALGYRKVGTGNQCEAEGRIEIVRNHKQECLSMCRILNLLFLGPGPLLLLPENIRIRRYNLQTDEYHDFLQEEERIVALDYDWDHNNTGLSMYSILGPQPLKNVITPVLCIMEAHFKIIRKKKSFGKS